MKAKARRDMCSDVSLVFFLSTSFSLSLLLLLRVGVVQMFAWGFSLRDASFPFLANPK